MKKVLLTVTFVCLAFLSYSLDTTSNRQFKPMKGTFTTQVGFALITNAPNVLSMGLNGRYFIKNKLAIRLTLMVNKDKQVENFDEFPDGTGGSGKFTSDMMINQLFLGVEKHFRGTSRLSPFIGLEVGYGAGKLKETGENSNGNSYMPAYSEESTMKISQINSGAFLGFDYWITHGLYLGIEYSFFGHFAFKENRSSKTMTQLGTTVTEYTPEFKANGFTTVNAVPFLRLGWTF